MYRTTNLYIKDETNITVIKEGGDEATNFAASPSCDATWLRNGFGFSGKGG
ncbi:hypothetical protein A2U01_0097336, partial [Trifolium medium]|nr:hypothetical protein [Trifolium medium]